MIRSIQASPVLHIGADVLTDRGEFSVEAWMTPSRAREEVFSSGGKLVYAQYVGEGRIQEYVPSASFKNGTTATEAVLEYDAGPNNENDDWSRLIDQKFACDAAGVAGDSWIKKQHPTIPEMLAENMTSSVMSEVALDGKPCYLFHSERRLGKGDTMIWELYLDKEKCEPVRESKTVQRGGKTSVHRTDYRIDHLDSDGGINWRLTAAELKVKTKKK
jgi:hypothetical protein